MTDESPAETSPDQSVVDLDLADRYQSFSRTWGARPSEGVASLAGVDGTDLIGPAPPFFVLSAPRAAANEVTVTRAEPTRSQDPAAIAAAIRRAAPGLALRVVPNPQLALPAAAEVLAPDHLLCATGSVYLAGIARSVLGARFAR